MSGQIDRTEGNVNANEGGGRIYANLPQSTAVEMPPIPAGAFVEITYPTLMLDDVVILPEAAVFDRDNVFVVVDGRADRRQIELLSKSEGQVYVRGDLQNGDQIISTRIPGLAQGTLVEVLGGLEN